MSRCPICRKPSLPEYHPFCSKRCADIDLARWLRGDYVIPGDKAHPAETHDEE
ncbi:MAG TPA: DNA gyrase inhibitor YacG [Paracoccus sp. (in: a-proteobacteria)]|uniref:DNA gyrase inhibitor YacG n=1 Tax=uncultured Paracoccus sp. TaxID=189685 RepID=UPI0026169463|nr:DNA gyrase inhibitor YacG [uncultured Paracoccus sp.]HMQ41988.1 DNA gyrase inhibitor YacG [Paracoccus sp. (in: a-proteobacteria)]HMR36981.1 DNA gyrase inhibitor YacG [Paracoccus sp. (in: a-proteobacteria)]